VDGQVSNSRISFPTYYHQLIKHQLIDLSYYSKEHYDRGVNTFSPEGRIYQIEYAIEAIKVSNYTSAIMCESMVNNVLTKTWLLVWIYRNWSEDK
jgi:hypothetical protein